jgi:hypothetical protein
VKSKRPGTSKRCFVLWSLYCANQLRPNMTTPMVPPNMTSPIVKHTGWSGTEYECVGTARTHESHATTCFVRQRSPIDVGRKHLLHPLLVEGGRAEPRRPPYLGFMFSLVGFHVFPLRVSCFPSWGFMFSRSGFHVFPRGVSCSPFQDTYPRFHMPHLI